MNCFRVIIHTFFAMLLASHCINFASQRTTVKKSSNKSRGAAKSHATKASDKSRASAAASSNSAAAKSRRGGLNQVNKFRAPPSDVIDSVNATKSKAAKSPRKGPALNVRVPPHTPSLSSAINVAVETPSPISSARGEKVSTRNSDHEMISMATTATAATAAAGVSLLIAATSAGKRTTEAGDLTLDSSKKLGGQLSPSAHAVPSPSLTPVSAAAVSISSAASFGANAPDKENGEKGSAEANQTLKQEESVPSLHGTPSSAPTAMAIVISRPTDPHAPSSTSASLPGMVASDPNSTAPSAKVKSENQPAPTYDKQIDRFIEQFVWNINNDLAKAQKTIFDYIKHQSTNQKVEVSVSVSMNSDSNNSQGENDAKHNKEKDVIAPEKLQPENPRHKKILDDMTEAYLKHEIKQIIIRNIAQPKELDTYVSNLYEELKKPFTVEMGEGEDDALVDLKSALSNIWLQFQNRQRDEPNNDQKKCCSLKCLFCCCCC